MTNFLLTDKFEGRTEVQVRLRFGMAEIGYLFWESAVCITLCRKLDESEDRIGLGSEGSKGSLGFQSFHGFYFLTTLLIVHGMVRSSQWEVKGPSIHMLFT